MKKILITLGLGFTLLFADGFETVTEEEYGKDWAFTVGELKIGCEMNLVVAFVKGDAFAYGLTGHSAQAVGRGIDSIWGDNPLMKGLKINLSPFIDRASKHCN